MENKLTTDELIVRWKQLRSDLKPYREFLLEKKNSRETALAHTKLEECIMWLGKELGRLKDNNPYPESYNPTNTIVVAEDIK